LKVRVVDAKELTTLKIGTERTVFYPETVEELLKLLEREGPLLPVGGGSNVVLSNDPKPLISLSEFKKVQFEGERLTLGAGVTLKKVLKLQCTLGFSLFEFLAGIPKAQVGGLVAQNAGAFGREVAQLLEEVTYLSYDGKLLKLKGKEAFGYRSSPFPEKGIVLEATFRVKPQRKEEVKEQVRRFVKARLQKQPPPVNTAGSTFKNPPLQPAGKLLDLCGFKGYFVGGVGFSEKHANFAVNRNGTFGEFQELIERAKERVREKFQVELELEVKVL